MGAKQSKRSVDISGKEAEGGEVAAAGAGGEGRVEPLADADALKPQLNGDAHIHETTDKEKQLDSGTPENEKDAATEKEGKDQEEKDSEKEKEAPVTNGESEPKAEDGDATPAAEDGKKPKKEKVKKKWSIRSISFSRKDKPKQEKKQKDEEPKTNGEPEKVPEEVAETTPETEVNEVAEEVKPSTEVKEEKTPETPVTEPITNGSSTPETPKVETPAAEEPSKESSENDRPEVKVETEPEQVPLNGLSLDEPKTEKPEVDQVEPEPSKPEETTVESPETVPATEIPVTKEVCVDQMPLIEPTPPPLPANPPPSSVASFAATTMAPELTDASLANAADITTNKAPTVTPITDTITTKADDTVNCPIEVQNVPADIVIAPSELSQSKEMIGDQETNSIKSETNVSLDQCSVVHKEDHSEIHEETDAAQAITIENLDDICKENSLQSLDTNSVKISNETPIETSQQTTNIIPNETVADKPNAIPVDIPTETSVDNSHETPVEISNEIPVDIPKENPVHISKENSDEISSEIPSNIADDGTDRISVVETSVEQEIVQEVGPTEISDNISNKVSVDSAGDIVEPERENTPSPPPSAVDEDVTTQNDAEDIVTEVYDSSDLILESPTIVVNSDHIDASSIKSSNETEMENIKNKTKDTIEGVVENRDNTDCNGVEEHKVLTNGEARPPGAGGECGDMCEAGSESMPPSLSEATEDAGPADGSESFPPPPADLCSESEPAPPHIPQEILKTDIIAEMIPEVPAVPELNTEIETTSDVAVAN